MDIDFILNLTQKDFEKAERLLEQTGLRSRLPVRAQDVIKMRQEYIQNRNLMAWSFVDYKSPSRQVDILITQDLKKTKTTQISVGGRKISVIRLEELLKMKLAAGRPQDLVDVQSIKEKLNEKNNKSESLTPEEAIQYLDDMRNLAAQIDEPTVAISLRVPANILRSLKAQARLEHKKYQSLLIEYLRNSLYQKPGR